MHSAATITMQIVVTFLRRNSDGIFQSVALNMTIPRITTPTNGQDQLSAAAWCFWLFTDHAANSIRCM